MQNAVIAMTVMIATVLLSWFVQSRWRRNGGRDTSGQDGWVGGDNVSEGHGWGGGHGHSGDHGATGGDFGGSDSGGGGDGGGGDGGGSH